MVVLILTCFIVYITLTCIFERSLFSFMISAWTASRNTQLAHMLVFLFRTSHNFWTFVIWWPTNIFFSKRNLKCWPTVKFTYDIHIFFCFPIHKKNLKQFINNIYLLHFFFFSCTLLKKNLSHTLVNKILYMQ